MRAECATAHSHFWTPTTWGYQEGSWIYRIMNYQECTDIIRAQVRRCAYLCNEKYGINCFPVYLHYTLTGTWAGICYAYQRKLDFNLPLLSEQKPADVAQTAGHELAHLADYLIYQKKLHEWNLRNSPVYSDRWRREELTLAQLCDMRPTPPKSHGQSWKDIMVMLGLEPQRCHNFDVTRHRRVRSPLITVGQYASRAGEARAVQSNKTDA